MNGRPDALLSGAHFVPCSAVPSIAIGTQRMLFRCLLIVSDMLALGYAFRISYWVRFDLGVTLSPEVVPDPQYYPLVASLLVPLFMLALGVFRLYEPRDLLGGVLEYSRIFHACSTATMIVILATFLMPQFVVSRVWVVAGWLASFLVVALNRFICRRLAYFLRTRGYLLVPALIVGNNQEAMTLAADLSDSRSSGLRLLGMVSSESGPEVDDTVAPPVLGRVRDIRRVVLDRGVEDVIVAITALSRQELLQLCEGLNSLPGVHLRLSSGLYEILATGVTVSTLGSVPLISLNKVRLEPHELFAKTALEYSVVLVGLLVTWPILLALALSVRLDSPGPILHRRKVLGASGRQFDAFKFRTMVVDGDALLRQRPELADELRIQHKLKQDPRVTRVGSWLRRYSLDELPQLFNVLLGQMSLVGPRMISADEAEEYGRHKLNLLTVKPGITGLWQVSGRSDLSYDRRVQLDMYYIRHYSVWLDLQILFVQTVPAVIRGHGAY